MGWWAQYLFKIGYYPIEYLSVKQDFLQWYYQATQNELVIEGLQVDNPQLVELTLDAARAAEKMDSEHPTIRLLDTFDEYISRIKTALAYLTIILILIGAGTLAISVYSIDERILRWIGMSIGAVLGVPVVSLSALYLILEHQLRNGAELVSKFNQRLVEKPGDVRLNERRWDKLTAQYLWNRSLARPRTIILLLLLTIIKVVRPSLYGSISGELQQQVSDFVGEDGKTIVKTEIERALQGKFIPPETTHESSTNSDRSQEGRW